MATTVHHTPSSLPPRTLPGAAPLDALNTITQTYATTAVDVPAATSAAVTSLVLTATAIAAKTASATLTDSDVASLAAMKVTNDQLAKDLGTKINAVITDNTALRADVLALRQVVNTVIDVLQANGLAG